MYCFFNDTATTEIYTLSLHDALPISKPRDYPVEPQPVEGAEDPVLGPGYLQADRHAPGSQDRKSTRLNSSHANISYAVFCLKKKKNSLLCSSLLFSVVTFLNSVYRLC